MVNFDISAQFSFISCTVKFIERWKSSTEKRFLTIFFPRSNDENIFCQHNVELPIWRSLFCRFSHKYGQVRCYVKSWKAAKIRRHYWQIWRASSSRWDWHFGDFDGQSRRELKKNRKVSKKSNKFSNETHSNIPSCAVSREQRRQLDTIVKFRKFSTFSLLLAKRLWNEFLNSSYLYSSKKSTKKKLDLIHIKAFGVFHFGEHPTRKFFFTRSLCNKARKSCSWFVWQHLSISSLDESQQLRKKKVFLTFSVVAYVSW